MNGREKYVRLHNRGLITWADWLAGGPTCAVALLARVVMVRPARLIDIVASVVVATDVGGPVVVFVVVVVVVVVVINDYNIGRRLYLASMRTNADQLSA